MSVVYDTGLVVGLGLMGGSVAKALFEKGVCGRLEAWEIDPVCRVQAEHIQAIDRVFGQPEDLTGPYGLIVIAVPVRATAPVLQAVLPFLDSKGLCVDTGSTKGHLSSFLATSACGRNRVVGCHPLAGAERSGWSSSTGALFTGESHCVSRSGYRCGCRESGRGCVATPRR